MDQLMCASFFHTHYWYKVGMLEVPAVNIIGRLDRYIEMLRRDCDKDNAPRYSV